VAPPRPPVDRGGARRFAGRSVREVPRLYRNRDFVLLWTGQSVSELGSAVTWLALPLVAVLVLHASPVQVGLVTAAGTVAWLVIGLPAGVWADRLPRRALLLGTDAARALLMASIPLAWSLHRLSVGYLVLVAFAVGLLSVLFDVTYPAYLPSVVERRDLVAGNGALAASESAANVVGPGLGGALVQLAGAPVALLADAASFAVSAVGLALMRSGGDGHVPASTAGRRLLPEVAEGLRYVRTHPLARSVAAAGTLANFVLGGYQALLVLFLARQVGLSAGAIGMMLTLSAVGGVVGSVISAPLAARVGDARLMWMAAAVVAAGGLLIPLTSRGAGLAWYVAGSLTMTAAIAAFNVCVRSAMQVAAPDAMLGRVTASVRLFTRGAMPAGALVAGALAGWLTPRLALAVLMGLLVFSPVVLLLSPVGRVREVALLAPVDRPEVATPAGGGGGSSGAGVRQS
jgi:MFS family permease